MQFHWNPSHISGCNKHGIFLFAARPSKQQHSCRKFAVKCIAFLNIFKLLPFWHAISGNSIGNILSNKKSEIHNKVKGDYSNFFYCTVTLFALRFSESADTSMEITTCLLLAREIVSLVTLQTYKQSTIEQSTLQGLLVPFAPIHKQVTFGRSRCGRSSSPLPLYSLLYTGNHL